MGEGGTLLLVTLQVYMYLPTMCTEQAGRLPPAPLVPGNLACHCWCLA